MADQRRLLRIEKEIMREVANTLIGRTADPRAQRIISITGVKVSPDLSHASIKYSVLGTDADRRTAQRMFEDSRGYYQSLIAKRLDTRAAPHIEFHYDETLAKQQAMNFLIDEALADDRKEASDSE